ncbi:MAG: LamG-like jellyroll fold domain-containing protein [Verrucomicrobiota bacterium]
MKKEMGEFSEKDLELVEAYVNETIERDQFVELEKRMAESADLRALVRKYLALDTSLHSELGEFESAWRDAGLSEEKKVVAFESARKLPVFVPMAAAAGIAFVCGILVMNGFRGEGEGSSSAEVAQGAEPSAEGFAVVTELLEAEWGGGESRSEGDSLGSEVFSLQSGTAGIRFFSGATMTVEGPAEIHLKSAWEAVCREGAIRMQVPPAARGFKLLSPGSEIIDLGTEFGLEVRDGSSRVEVFDGEIAVKHGEEKERLVKQGGAWSLPHEGKAEPIETGMVRAPDPANLDSHTEARRNASFAKWEAHRDALAMDKRLIAYYTFDDRVGSGLIPNLVEPESYDGFGAVILAESVDGRWPGMKSALEFPRAGARARVNLTGEFSAYTFMCWVRIDSLDRSYNALFMGDGYETGEPHWQIRNDGKLMLSVMVDDQRPNPKAANDDGFHRVYFSPPFWDPSMSGRWINLASVFDPVGREVSHYVNGERISTQEIEPDFFIDELRIGNAEIGNWGQPFREDPTFALRNLNGRMDEIAVFDAALSADEVQQLYRRSRANFR